MIEVQTKKSFSWRSPPSLPPPLYILGTFALLIKKKVGRVRSIFSHELQSKFLKTVNRIPMHKECTPSYVNVVYPVIFAMTVMFASDKREAQLVGSNTVLEDGISPVLDGLHFP